MTQEVLVSVVVVSSRAHRYSRRLNISRPRRRQLSVEHHHIRD